MKTKRSVSRLRSFFTVPVIITGLILATVLFASIFANFIVPFDPEEANLADSLCKPLQNGHLLGTDKLGRDLFSRLIFPFGIGYLSLPSHSYGFPIYIKEADRFLGYLSSGNPILGLA